MLRVNGVAETVTTPELMQRFVVNGKPPRSVMLIEVREVYLHCTKALRRSERWNPAKHVTRAVLPSFGQMGRDQRKMLIPTKIIDMELKTVAQDKTNKGDGAHF